VVPGDIFPQPISSGFKEFEKYWQSKGYPVDGSEDTVAEIYHPPRVQPKAKQVRIPRSTSMDSFFGMYSAANNQRQPAFNPYAGLVLYVQAPEIKPTEHDDGDSDSTPEDSKEDCAPTAPKLFG